MSQTWEDKFGSWARPPSDSEIQRCENARVAVRKAIDASVKLKTRDIKVFSQGSYRNNTNVRQESDVDIGVVCNDTFFYDTPPNTTAQTFNISAASYFYPDFKNDVGQALVDYFGASDVVRGNKAFDIKETSYHAEIDVAPFFEHRRYAANGSYLSGVELRPDNDQQTRIINWPEQHYENGVSKNNQTSRRYKSVVRILKNLKYDMEESGNAIPKSVIGFLIECLVWNVSNSEFGHATYYDDVKSSIMSLYNNIKTDKGCDEWGEVSELKYLFRGPQKWTREDAQTFLLKAWQHVGFS